MKRICYKSRVAYSSSNIFSYSHTLLNLKLIVTTEEKDLGVAADSSLKTSAQCTEAVKKANGVLGCVNTMSESHVKSSNVTTEIKDQRYHITQIQYPASYTRERQQKLSRKINTSIRCRRRHQHEGKLNIKPAYTGDK